MVFHVSALLRRHVAPVARRATDTIVVAVSAIVTSVLVSAADCRAEPGALTTSGGGPVPTLEALHGTKLPRGAFVKWCGDRTIMEVNRRYEIYNEEGKASPLSFPKRSSLICGDDPERLIFVDDEDGRISEVDIAKGVVTRTLATYDNTSPQDISFSPDLKRVVSGQSLTLAPSIVDLKVLKFKETIGRFQWRSDSSVLFGVSSASNVEIYNAQGQRIGSGPLPVGHLFRGGWFADSRSLFLYLALERDEFGSGVVIRCPIEGWKCVTVARNVLQVSVSGNGTMGLVRAIGKYKNDGEDITYPRGYVAEIRNSASQVVARQTFKSSERNDLVLAIAPSGMKAVFTWHEYCPAEKQDSARCSDGGARGIVMDLPERLE